MNARAATNLEASVSYEKQKAQQEVQLLQKEAFRLERPQEVLVAELQQTTKRLSKNSITVKVSWTLQEICSTVRPR
jgi:hypothetical protein